jgi:hypothetical protein
MRNGEPFLIPKIGERLVHHLGTPLPAELNGGIRTAGIDDDDFVAPLQAAQTSLDDSCFVERDKDSAYRLSHSSSAC